MSAERWWAVFDASGNLVSTGTSVADPLPEGWRVEVLPSRPVGVWDGVAHKFGGAVAKEDRQPKVDAVKSLMAKQNRSPQDIADLLATLRDLYPELT